MHVVVIHQHFRLPEEGGAMRIWYMANHLVDQGHQVTVLAGRNNDMPNLRDGQLHVVGLAVPYQNGFSIRDRVGAFREFARTAWDHLRRRGQDYDICIASSTPLSVAIPAMRYAKKYKRPYFLDLRDLWPKALEELGIISNPLVLWGLRQLERRAYARAAGITVASEPAYQHLQDSGTDSYFLPNMTDLALFDQSGRPIPPAFSDENPLILCYAGSLGHLADAEALLNLATAMKEQRLPVVLTIVGDGSQHRRLLSEAQRQQLPQLLVAGRLNRAQTASLLAAAHVQLVHFRSSPGLKWLCPNKYMDGLAAGLPIVHTVDGWVRWEVDEAKCGLYIGDLGPHMRARAIAQLLQSPTDVVQMGRRARALAVKYDHHTRLADWYSWLTSRL